MQTTIIEQINARKILDSRGDFTIEVEVFTTEGYGRSAAPAGASRGLHEVVAFPEGGIEAAIKAVNDLVAPELIGVDAADQNEVDQILHLVDGTENFSKIGGATALALSMASAKAAASALGVPLYRHLGGANVKTLPYPVGNVLGGGKHVKGLAQDIQEVLVIPVGARSFVEAALINVKVHKELARLIPKVFSGFLGGKGDEGAWVASLSSYEALQLVKDACVLVEDDVKCEVKIGIDLAASSLWDPEKRLYVYRRDGRLRSSEDQYQYVVELVEKYGLAYVEDPFHEEDFENFAKLTKDVKNCLIVGDDLYVTNIKRLKEGVKIRASNGVIIKPNQVGTLSDAFNALQYAKDNGYVTVISHRSGETEDETIAHLAVAWSSPLIKTGVIGGERTVKLNELIRIEEELKGRAVMSRRFISVIGGEL
ncbi:MAG: phosphopyruvate hydratase [Candidatus Nezhaarchaeales archaeon]